LADQLVSYRVSLFIPKIDVEQGKIELVVDRLTVCFAIIRDWSNDIRAASVERFLQIVRDEILILEPLSCLLPGMARPRKGGPSFN
jgi:hypothetical protein